jgi:hypothetical protein
MSAAELIDRARRELDRGAAAMPEYVKSDIPYYGVRIPDLRRVCRPIVAAAHRVGPAFDDTVEKLFVAAAHREVRYAAVELAKHSRYRADQTPDRLPAYAD